MKRLKLATVFLIALLPVACLGAAAGSTNIAVWESKTTGNQTIVDEAGNLKTPNLTVTSNLTVNVGLTVAGDLTANGDITGDGATIISNVIFVGDGSAVTSLNAGNITSGNLSTNVGGAGTLTGILKATSGVVAPAVADTDYVQVSSVYGSATAVNGAIGSAQVIVTNAIAMLDVGGSAFSDYTLIHVWMSESLNGPITTNGIEDLTLSTGTEVVETTADADYLYVTASDGTAVATITITGDRTNYLNVAVGPRVTSTEIITLP